MTLWDKVRRVPELETVMKEYYNQHGLYEVRVNWAKWVEGMLRNEDPTNEQTAAQHFFSEMKRFIESTAPPQQVYQIGHIITRIEMLGHMDFYLFMRKGIAKEEELIGSTHLRFIDSSDDVYTRLQEQYRRLNVIEPNLQKVCDEYEQFAMCQANGEHMNAAYTLRGHLILYLQNIVKETDELQTLVIERELKNWQRQQALAGNGSQINDNLNQIQSCIELLLEIVIKLLQIIDFIQQSTANDRTLEELGRHVRNQQAYLILSAFIVEKQPPQVMKTNTRFAAAVRWLIGPQLGMNLNCPNVECIILSEGQAHRHCAQRQMTDATPHSSGEIQNNVGTMEYQQQNRVLSANFRNMQLKKIKRTEKRGTESVMDEKFALLFYTSVMVSDYCIRVWTLSLPVVVIVHGNQEPQSWATITWDNAFSEIVREPFQVPDKVPWSSLSDALYTKFLAATGRGPTAENKCFLYEKLFRREYMMLDQNDLVTWTQFCKEPLPDRTFTFWDWFYSTMKLTKDHLMGPWKADLIIGFINKRTTEEILQRCPPGTFLLRFSDSEMGGITVAFVGKDNGRYMLTPWTARDLGVRGLADRIQDLDLLKYAYPSNKNKDDAFGEFYSRTEQGTRDGYVRNIIMTTVPEMRENPPNVTPDHVQSPHPNDINLAAGYQNSTIMHLDNLLFAQGNNMEDIDILNQFATFPDGIH